MTYSECLLQTNKKSKILVIGWSNVKIVDLKKVLDSLGIERERVDFELMPEKIKNNFNLKKYYTDILIGPMEHSIAGKGDFSSLISKLERDYANGVGPKVTRICDSNSLKISKSSFEKALLKTDYYNIVRKKESC